MTLRRSPQAPHSQLNLLLPCQVCYQRLHQFVAPFLYKDWTSFPGTRCFDTLLL